MATVPPGPPDSAPVQKLVLVRTESLKPADETLTTSAPAQLRSPMPSENSENAGDPMTGTTTTLKGQDQDLRPGSAARPDLPGEHAELVESLAEDDKLDQRRAIRSFYMDFIFPEESLESRRTTARRRLLQSQSFQSLMEDRMTELEEKVRKILNEPEQVGKPKAEEALNGTQTIRELSWSEFRGTAPPNPQTTPINWKHKAELDLEPKAMIEILTEQPRYNELSTAEEGRTQRGQDRKPEAQGSSGLVSLNPIACDPQQGDVPHLIRIRSTLLLKVLHDLTGMNTCIGPHRHVLVLFRPFKLLVCFADKIREQYRRLCRNSTESLDRSYETETGNLVFPPRETETDEARECLRLLGEVLDKWLQPKIKLYSTPDSSLSMVGFDDLWYVFKPGAEVRTTGRGQIQLLRILRVTGGREALARSSDPPNNHASVKLKDKGYIPGSFILECFFIHFDGHQYGPVNQTFTISKFYGHRELTSLPVIPLECDPRKDQIRQNLLNRGRKFVELSNPRVSAHKKYCGLTLDTRQDQVDSNVIIDFELAFVETPDNKPTIMVDNLVDDDPRELRDVWQHRSPCDIAGCCGKDIIHYDYEVDLRNGSGIGKSPLLDPVWQGSQLENDHLVLLPPKVYGFVLRTRKWASFDIDLLDEVEYTNGWDRLVIEEQTKKTILALVETHEKPKDGEGREKKKLTSMDLVGGKGNGLIILLHGEPGVGKTSTAECVADHTKRPLFPVTCGDIGDNAQLVETNLERNFQLAHKWGCVLLLDEADIFLSKRNNHDITRNAIVSVFLRTLEYYSGILFLTTNRVGLIDRAFKSRIHLALYYPKLDKKTSLTIWENNINSLMADINNNNKAFEVTRQEIVDFAKTQYKENKRKNLRPWNGRQIRNAFQTAIAIAHFEAAAPGAIPRLGKSQFEKVAKSAIEFDTYLNELHRGKDEAQLAQEGFQRLDDWKGIPIVMERARPIRAFGGGGRGSRHHRRRGEYESEDYVSEEENNGNSDASTSASSPATTSESESESDHRSSKRKSKRRKRSADSNSADEAESKSKSRSKRKKR